MKQTNKILLTTILMTVFLMAILPFVMAAAGKVELTSPKAGNNYTGTVNFTANTTGQLEEKGSFNISLVCDSAGTAVTAADTWVVTVANSTAGQNVTTSASATLPATETMTYNCSAFLDNGSTAGQAWWSASMPGGQAIGITFDSTAPVCSIEAMQSKIPYKGIIDIKWSVTDAVSLVSAAISIDGPQDQTTITDSDAVETRTLTTQETKYVGSWTVSALGTDRPGNACTTVTDTFKSYLPGEEEPTAPTGVSSQTLLLIGIGAVVIYLIFFRKK